MFPKDWKFDVGIRSESQNGKWVDVMVVEPYCSSIGDVRFRELTRQELLQLRSAISTALRMYPDPTHEDSHATRD